MCEVDRRKFIKTISAVAAGTMMLPASITFTACNSTTSSAPSWQGRRLIILRLEGGHDGLFALLPKEHEVIDSLRPNLSKNVKRNGITIKKDWILNQNLHPLLPLLERKELAFIPFVGYPNPNTSHFKSAEIWETGLLPGESSAKTGWIGRLLDKNQLNIDENQITSVISVNTTHSLFDQGTTKQGFIWQNNEPLAWYESKINHWLSNNKGSKLYTELKDQKMLMQWMEDINPSPNYPTTELGQQLSKIFGVIQTDKPFRVLHASQGGYDTHLAADKRLPDVYEDLSSSLSHLVTDLRKSGYWENTLIFIYSEFGRTIDENQNNGTDHGTAGMVILMGNNESVYEYTSVELKYPEFVQHSGEIWLRPLVDFRDIYKDITDKWLLA